MNDVAIIVGLCWLVFVVVWTISALGAKRNLRQSWWQSPWVRIIVLVIVGTLLIKEGTYIWPAIMRYHYVFNPVIAWVGATFAVVGIALALWARVYIGRNWGMPMSLKENRELVATGPYHYIRHPIYAGVMLAMIGTALAISPIWLVIFVVYFLFFLYSAKTEEGMLAKEFPEAYPAYKRRSKMIIPFIL